MSDEAKYDEPLRKSLQNLPVPDEEQAWQKMKQLLDGDDRRRPLLFFLNGCAGWGVLGVLLLALAVGIYWLASGTEKPGTAKSNQPTAAPSTDNATPIRKEVVLKAGTNKTSSDTVAQTTQPPSNQNRHYKKTQPVKKGRVGLTTNRSNKPRQLIKKETTQLPPTLTIGSTTGRVEPNNTTSQTTETTQPQQSRKPAPGAPFQDSAQIGKDTVPKRIDTVPATAATQKEPVVAKKSTPAKQGQTDFYFGAGLSLMQQIPLAGQTLVPYNQYGRTASLADYLPAPFIRWHNGDNWFVHADFRYGAPQAARVLAYSAATVSDSSSNMTTTTTLRLKKTFYHQLPLSFNHTVLKNWTVGAGGMYSRFHRAVSEREVRVRNNQSGAETVSKTIINVPAAADSSFTLSQVHLLLQTEYRWRRWGAGLRYTKGLQPFIRYTQNNALHQEKAHALQFYLRYQFWQSGRKEP